MTAELDFAPRNTAGRVEATTDVVILRPAHLNGTLLFEVLNRGRKLMTGWVDEPTCSKAPGSNAPRTPGAASC